MRGFVATLAVILVLMIAFVAYFFVGGTLSASPMALSAAAAEQAEAFEAARALVHSGRAPQTFATGDIGAAEQYRLVDVTIGLKNIGLFDAEWLEIEVTPAQGDAAVYSLSGAGADIAAMSRGQINLKLLTSAPENARRTVIIRYYVMGMRRGIRVEV